MSTVTEYDPMKVSTVMEAMEHPGGASGQGLGAVVDIEDASFSYGTKTVLRGVTSRIEAGHAMALLGPNGSGKTTLLRAMLGMVTVSHGSMKVVGHQPGHAPRGSIGYVPQINDLDPTFPVRVTDVVAMGVYSQMSVRALLMPLSSVIRQRCAHALERVGMGTLGRRPFGELSGGQQQRVLLARCLAASPRLILLDEPFNGLDQPNRKALLQILHTLKKDGVTIVVSTHDLSLAREACEYAALLNGHQIACGPCSDVLTPELIERAFAGLYGHHSEYEG